MSQRSNRESFLHLRLDRDLKERVRRYAERRHTTITALVTAFFRALLHAEEEKKDAEQI